MAALNIRENLVILVPITDVTISNVFSELIMCNKKIRRHFLPKLVDHQIQLKRGEGHKKMPEAEQLSVKTIYERSNRTVIDV